MKIPRISIIVSTDENGGIGKGNLMVWHIKKDLVHLKKLTQNKIVIMGENTFKSMTYYYDKSGRIMPAKMYIVLTYDKNLKSERENISFAHSLNEAFKKARKLTGSEIFIIGGAGVFKQTISLADRIYLTLVSGNYNCDTFFPDYSDFKEISSEDNSEDGYKFAFKIFEKKV